MTVIKPVNYIFAGTVICRNGQFTRRLAQHVDRIANERKEDQESRHSKEGGISNLKNTVSILAFSETSWPCTILEIFKKDKHVTTQALFKWLSWIRSKSACCLTRRDLNDTWRATKVINGYMTNNDITTANAGILTVKKHNFDRSSVRKAIVDEDASMRIRRYREYAQQRLWEEYWEVNMSTTPSVVVGASIGNGTEYGTETKVFTELQGHEPRADNRLDARRTAILRRPKKQINPTSWLMSYEYQQQSPLWSPSRDSKPLTSTEE